MQKVRHTRVPARSWPALVTLAALSFISTTVQRCSMPARGQGERGNVPVPSGTTAPTANAPEPGSPRAGGLNLKTLSDSFPDAVSYPATSLATRLEGPIADSIRKAAAAGLGVDASRVYAQSYTSLSHPLLAGTLPHASFTRTLVSAEPEFSATYGHAVMDGKLYRLEALNRLLLDAGFTFDSTETPAIAKIAVLFATFGKTFNPSGQLRDGPAPTDSGPGAGFPAITFLSVGRGDWKHPRHGDTRHGVLVDCVVGGERQRLLLEFFGRRRIQPEVLTTEKGDIIMWFDLTSYPAREPNGGQRRGALDDPPSTLTVAGDTWVESNGSEKHYFTVTKVNNSPASVRVDFTVTPVTCESIYFRFARKQDGNVGWESAAVSSGSSTLEWWPTYDSSAEYSVTAHASVVSDSLSNNVLVDPEAWRTQTTYDGKTILVHFMKYNDTAGPLDAAQTAAVFRDAIQASWTQEVP